MHLGLWANDDDLAALHLGVRMEERGHTVTRITPGRVGADATDLVSWVVSGADLDACGAHLVRALPSPFVVPAPAEPAASVARRAFEAQERVLLAHAALAAAEAHGTRVINPCAALPFESKLYQLGAFARASLPVPRTIVTSLPLAAERFVDALAAAGAQALAKPLIGGATARLVDGAVRERFATLSASPIIVQERIVGDDVRVTVVDGKVVSAVVIESDAIDYRDDPAYAAGRARYRVTELPDDALTLAARAATLCAHRVSGVDLKHARDGRYLLLEANSAPRWLDIEEKTGAPITQAVMAVLAA